jgi:hypothetical protein
MLVGVSFVVGLSIPAFYEWTGSDQSRPSPLIHQTGAGLILLAVTAMSLLPWLPIQHDPPPIERRGKIQFKIRTILVTTAAVAACLAVFRETPLIAASGCLYAAVLCYVVRLWILCRPLGWQVSALLACMYFPFAWVVSFDELLNFVAGIPGLPAFFLTLLFGSLLLQHTQNLTWLSMLLASAELVLGVWMIRLGPRRTIAYLLFVLITSIFGSFVLNALTRM